ncbi:MAG: nucleoid-associated protein [Crocinitomix sp.]|jgi:nucleoid-associated protein
MEIRKIIIHLIDKERGTAPRQEKSEHVLTVDDGIKVLVERLNEAFKKSAKVLRTEFKTEKRVFQDGVIEFSENRSRDNFLNFASNSIDRMADLIAGINLATGGYFVFISYKDKNRKYLAVFLVRDSEEIIFKREEESNDFIVDTTTIVDTDKLAMAVRVDIDKLRNDEGRYLHFTNKQQSQSQYFIDWIEANLAEKNSEDTSALIRLIHSIPIEEMPLKAGTQERYLPEELRSKIFDSINASGRLVRIRDLSSLFWDDEDYLSNKIEELEIDMSTEFQATLNILKRLKKYVINSGKMKLEFSRNDIEHGKVKIGDRENQIIIEDEGLRSKFDDLE